MAPKQNVRKKEPEEEEARFLSQVNKDEVT